MSRRITLPRNSGLDVTQKVIEALADSDARSILLSTVRRAQSASSLAALLEMPMSTVYKKLGDLETLTLLIVEEELLTRRGRNIKMYRSRIRGATIEIRAGAPRLKLVPR